MKTVLRRLTGTLLIIAAIGGLAFSIFGLVTIRRLQTTVTEALTEGVNLLSSTLDTTTQGLVTTQESINNAIISMRALQSTVATTAKTIQSTEPTVTEIAKLMGEDLPNTIVATQASLKTAQESAEIIDSVLTAISFIPGIEYEPEIPLHTALGEVSKSVEELPASFVEMEDSLGDTAHNLQIVQVDLALMVDSIRQVEVSLEQYEDVITGYQEVLDELQTKLDEIRPKLPEAVEIVGWGLTIFLAWMAIAQIGLLTQGWELLTWREEDLPG